MRILPVVDLLGGKVVRAIRGDRANYRPLESPQIDEPTPECVGKFLRKQGKFREAYVADLDLIQGQAHNRDAWGDLVAAGLTIWLDAGVTTVVQGIALYAALRKLSRKNRLIVGLETLTSIDTIRSLVEWIGEDHLVFSLDLRAGKPIHDDESWAKLSPAKIAGKVIAAGCRSVILLDLADVGTGNGLTTLPLLKRLSKKYPEVEWWIGGGARGPEDISAAEAAGATGCLVGSAIYDGKISPKRS